MSDSDKQQPNGNSNHVEPDVGTPILPHQLIQVGELLDTYRSRLEDFRRKVPENDSRTPSSIFEGLVSDIRNGSKNLSWFGLAFRLAAYISSKIDEVEHVGDEEKWATLTSQTAYVGKQIGELRLFLPTDNDVFRIAAGTLLYCAAVIRYLERKPTSCQRFFCVAPSDSGIKLHLERAGCELKTLQDNLTFAGLAAVRSRVSHAPDTVATPDLGPAISIGIEQHVNHIVDFLKQEKICTVGIHGQGGLGKTSLLHEVISAVEKNEKRLFAFIEVGKNPDEVYMRKLQASLLQQLGGGRKDFSTTSKGRNALLDQLVNLKMGAKQARIAIDNVFDVKDVIELLPPNLGKVLPAKSCVLITSRSSAVVSKLDQICKSTVHAYVHLSYKLPSLSPQQSRDLFLFHASKKTEMPTKSAESLLDFIVPQCEGLPLALKVIGSLFSDEANRTEDQWVTIGKKMKEAEELLLPEDQIFGKLQVSYDKLTPELKEAFLDIAVLFRGWDWRIVERIVGMPKLSSLVEQALVTVKTRDTEGLTGIAQLTRYSEYPWKMELVEMHDLLSDIGSSLSLQTRVRSEDSSQLPELLGDKNMELKRIKGISLLNCQDPLQGRFVDKMEGLKILILQDTAVRGYRVESLHDLEFMYWGWSRPVQDMKFPFQLARCRKLDMVMIRCNKIDLSLRFPAQLKDLTLMGCVNMERVPEPIFQLTALTELHLTGWSRLQELPASLGNLTALRRFHMEDCGTIRSLPKSIDKLQALEEIDLSGCLNLKTLPPEIGNLQSLQKLNLNRCKSFVRLPPEIGTLQKLTRLYLGHCNISVVCQEVGDLSALEELSLTACGRIEKLPKEIGNLTSLQRLSLSACKSLRSLPKEIKGLTALQRLSLVSCTSLTTLPDEVCELTSLQYLDLDYCEQLLRLPKGIENLGSLHRLSLSYCSKLTELPTEITFVPSLQVLNVVGCPAVLDFLPDLRRMIRGQVYVHTDDELKVDGRRLLHPSTSGSSLNFSMGSV